MSEIVSADQVVGNLTALGTAARFARRDGEGGSMTGERAEAIEPIEDRQRFVGRRPAVDRGLHEAPRFTAVAALERRDAALQQLLGLPLALGQGAARPLDVGTGTRVTAIEKQHACPDADRVIVLCGEVMIEAGEQQLLDFRVAIRFRRGSESAGAFGTKRI